MLRIATFKMPFTQNKKLEGGLSMKINTHFVSEQRVHASKLSTCALPNLHNTSSTVRLHQSLQSAPAHMLAVQGRI